MTTFALLTMVVLGPLIPQVKADICKTNSLPQYEFYPNVTSRSSFVQCSNSSGKYVAVSYVCPDGLVFRPRHSHNDLSPLCCSNVNMYTFDCRRQKNGNGSYSGDKSLYVTCTDGIPRDLHQSPLVEYLDAKSLKCVLSCSFQRRVGLFPTADGGYYMCSYDYGAFKWNLNIRSCQSDTTFNPSLQFCLRTPSGNDEDPSDGSTTTTDVTTTPATSTITSDPSPGGSTTAGDETVVPNFSTITSDLSPGGSGTTAGSSTETTPGTTTRTATVTPSTSITRSTTGTSPITITNSEDPMPTIPWALG